MVTQDRVPDWVAGELASELTGISSLVLSDGEGIQQLAAAREAFGSVPTHKPGVANEG